MQQEWASTSAAVDSLARVAAQAEALSEQGRARPTALTPQQLRRLSKLVEAELLADEQQLREVPLGELPLGVDDQARQRGRHKVLDINVDLALYYAKVALRSRQYERARALYVRCIEWNPRNGRGWLGLAKLLERFGHIAQARAVFREGIRLASVGETEDDGAAEAESEASASISDDDGGTVERVSVNGSEGKGGGGEVTGAVRQTIRKRSALFGASRNARNPFLLQAWAVMEEAAGDVPLARRLLLQGTRDTPYHAPSWVSLAVLEHRQGNDDAAWAHIEQAVAVDPHSYYAWCVHGTIAWRSRQAYAEARASFERSIQINPRNSATYHALGCMEAWALHNPQRARELFDLALQRANPRCRYVMLSWARLEWECFGDLNAARALYARGTQTHPEDAAIWQSWALMEARRGGDMRLARKLFEAGIRADPHHLPVWQAWALVEADESRGGMGMVRARQLFQEGVWAAPDSPDVAAVWHAWASMELVRARDLDRARECCRMGLEAVESALQQGQPTSNAGTSADALRWTPPTGSASSASAHSSSSSSSSSPSAPHHRKNLAVEGDEAQSLQWTRSGSPYQPRKRLRMQPGKRRGVRVYNWQAAVPPLLSLWAQIEAVAGDMARARELFERALDADPANAIVWQAYESAERDLGGADGMARAETVQRRKAMALNIIQRSRRRPHPTSLGDTAATDTPATAAGWAMQVGGPQAGDFAQTGTWVEYHELARLTREEIARWRAPQEPGRQNEQE